MIYNNQNSSKSFSLIEVVFACTALILFLMAGLIIFGTSIRNIAISKHRLQAVYLATQAQEGAFYWRDDYYFRNDNTLNLNNLNAAMSAYNGTYPLDDTAISFVRSNTISDMGLGKRLVTIVTWTDFGMSQSVTLSTHLTLWQNFL